MSGTEAFKANIDTAAVRTAVELRLRENGILVAKDPDSATPPVTTMLSVYLYGFPAGDGRFYSYSRVEVGEPARLMHDHDILAFVVTWSVESFRSAAPAGLGAAAPDQVRGLMDQFVNAFLSVNPRGSRR